MQYLSNSHTQKIREWVDDLKQLNHKPDIVVLQKVSESEDIDAVERIWISKYIDKGATLLNERLVSPIAIRPDLDEIIGEDIDDQYKAVGRFVAERRKRSGLTQQQFAEKIGIALTVLRKIEQGKSNFVMSALLYVLSIFKCTIRVVKK